MILDFHSHILPGVDHGSDSLETSAKQVALAAKYGVDHVIATSHFYPHSRSASSFLERRAKAYASLTAATRDIGVNVILGAEVLLCNAIEKHPDLDDLCIAGTKTLLLELPFADFQSDYCRSVYNLLSNDYTVVMAHAERYDPSWISEMLEAGAKLQLNAPAFSLFKIKRVMPWLENGDVVAIGSDIHGVNQSAYKLFRKAVKKAEKIAPQIETFSKSLL